MILEQSLILTKKCCTEGNSRKKKEAQDKGRDGIKMGKKKVELKYCILGMTEVHTLLFQFKFFYSFNISCAK